MGNEQQIAKNPPQEPQVVSWTQDPKKWDLFIHQNASALVEGLPFNVSSEDLKRACSQLKLAFSRQSSSKIQECSPGSVVSCIALSAASGLLPGGFNPDVDIIPRKNKHSGLLELNWQISYRGYIRLCRRNPGYDMTARVVYEGDEFDVDLGAKPTLHHKPNLNFNPHDPREIWEAIRFAYVVIERPHGLSTNFDYLTKAQIASRRALAQSDAFWGPWPAEMTQKTISRHAGSREMFPTDDPARYAMSLDIKQDNAGVTELGGDQRQLARNAGSSSVKLLEDSFKDE